MPETYPPPPQHTEFPVPPRTTPSPAKDVSALASLLLRPNPWPPASPPWLSRPLPNPSLGPPPAKQIQNPPPSAPTLVPAALFSTLGGLHEHFLSPPLTQSLISAGGRRDSTRCVLVQNTNSVSTNFLAQSPYKGRQDPLPTSVLFP